MGQDIHPYHTLAMMMHYPAQGYKRTFNHDLKPLMQQYPEEVRSLEAFADYVNENSEKSLQELYTKTFDVQAICFLDIGYVLFGEDYKRGMFLVHMKGEHAKVQNDCGTELADHLPNVLNLLPKMKDPELASEFTTTFLIPALEKMLGNFKENGNVYSGPLRTILAILKKDYLSESPTKAEPGVPS